MTDMNKLFGGERGGVEIKPVVFGRAPRVEDEVRRPSWAHKNNRDVQNWTPNNLPSQAQPTPEEAAPHTPETTPAGVEEAFDEARTAGHQEGLEQGRAEGLEAAKQEIEAQTEALRDLSNRLGQEIEALGHLRQTWMAEAESQMVELTMDIGQRLAGEAQLDDHQWVAPLVRQAAEALTESDRVVCRLSSDLALRLEQAGAWPDIKGMIFEIAPEMEDLDLVVESRFGRVDASFKERVLHLERTLRERLDAMPEISTDQEVA